VSYHSNGVHYFNLKTKNVSIKIEEFNMKVDIIFYKVRKKDALCTIKVPLEIILRGKHCSVMGKLISLL